MTDKFDILTVEEMAMADQLTIASGVKGAVLMENAGRSVVWQILRRWPAQQTVVLCGPGNNGGDGFVVARLLQAKGWPVRVALLGDRESLKGDAALMAQQWQRQIEILSNRSLDKAELIVDALFGAGLCRPVSDELAKIFNLIKERNLAVVAIDIPTGVEGNTGKILGTGLQAAMTVTFFRAKPAHYLLPGRLQCGTLFVSDIGIGASVLDQISPDCRLNDPALWSDAIPVPGIGGHKYHRGHAVIRSGKLSAIGAAQLAARACLKTGAGAVTIASNGGAIIGHAGNLNALMLASLDDDQALALFLKEKRISAVLIGPGNGVDDQTRLSVFAALGSDADVVLDADALTVFASDPAMLFSAIGKKSCGNVVLTPHEAEFSRLFDMTGSKCRRANEAARLSGAIVIIKGADSVIASPDGRSVINNHATPYLATAGSGDVLAGIVAGFLAQGMTAFEAACAAVWIHGETGLRLGGGLTAEDIIAEIPNTARWVK